MPDFRHDRRHQHPAPGRHGSGDPQAGGRAHGQQRVRGPVPAHRRRRPDRRRQRARQAAGTGPSPERAAGDRDPRPLGPHPGRPGDARCRVLRQCHHRGCRHAAQLRRDHRGRLGDRGRPSAGCVPSSRPATRRDRSASASRASPSCSVGTPCSRVVPAPRRSRVATSPPSSVPWRTACSPPWHRTRWCCRATATTPPSATSPPTSRSGSTVASERSEEARRPGPSRSVLRAATSGSRLAAQNGGTARR